LASPPELSRLAREGAQGAIRPSFPSKTFPNHYTLVTGLRPDHHGIVDNNMRDPEIPGVTFALSNRAAVIDPRWWEDGEPIWVTAERAGLRTAIMFWPGSEAPVRGVRPSAWRTYDAGLAPQARVDQVLAWLEEPALERPRFLALYFEAVDTAGHNHGPGSPQVKAALQETDAAIGRLVHGLAARGLVANIVVVSDHGMAEISPDRVIRLDEIAPTDVGTPLTMGAFMTYYPAAGREAEAEAALLKPHPHMSCWRKGGDPQGLPLRRAPPRGADPLPAADRLGDRHRRQLEDAADPGWRPRLRSLCPRDACALPGPRPGFPARDQDAADRQCRRLPAAGASGRNCAGAERRRRWAHRRGAGSLTRM
jgi:predicted AlkP superfamily pyrophosphatase or phosphodiesterase